MAVAFGGLVGLMIGSFLNVVVHRLPAGESIVSPGSHCPACGSAVAAYDNVPVLSWVLLRGSCRSCGSGISLRYPVIELITGAVFMAVVASRGIGPELALLLPFAAVLVAVAVIDLDHRIIPNRIVGPAAVYGVAATIAVRPDALVEALAAGAGALGFLLAAALVHPGGMGMGDVKLAGVMGIYLGVSVVPALLVAFVAGSFVGLALMARHGASARKRAIPFGPFLALGGFAAMVAGPELVQLYVDGVLGG